MHTAELVEVGLFDGGVPMKSKQRNPKYEVDSVLVELDGESPRAAAIVGAAWLDDLLLRLLTGFMVPGKKTERLLGVEGHGPIGSNSARTRLAYSLGLIAESEMEDLLTIGKIRNLFAHRIHRSTFDNPKIRELCLKLKTGPRFVSEPGKATPRELFSTTVATLAYLLANRPQNKFAAQRKSISGSTMEDVYGEISAG